MKKPLIDVANQLYFAFETLNNRLFDAEIANPIITLQKEKQNVLGHYLIETTWFNGCDEYNEININPLRLSENAYTILGILLHEMCHAYNAQNGIKDVSGKKHNKKFIALAESVGLIDGENDGNWGYTVPTEDLIDNFNEWFDEDFISELNDCIYMYLDVEEKPKKKRAKTIFKYTCPNCGMEVKAKAEKNIVCGACNEQLEMEEVENDEEEEG